LYFTRYLSQACTDKRTTKFGRQLSVNSPAPELTARGKVRAKVSDRDGVRIRIRVSVKVIELSLTIIFQV